MKRVITAIMASAVIMMITIPVTFGEPQTTKFEASHVINRTAAIIRTAQRFAFQGKKSDGLGLSIGHQVFARELYSKGVYSNSVFHSLRARGLAARVISLNKESMLNEALYDRIEEKLAGGAPSGSELDRRLKESKIEIPSDQAAVEADVNLDVN